MEPVAIIGSSFRFPGGATTDSSFWELLKNPRDIQTEPDPDRLNLRKFHHHDSDHHGCSPVTKSYFLDADPRRFDAAFFNISPLEAEAMDPQQRVLLETVFEASESAGYTLDRLRGSNSSVHVGVMTNDYADIQLRDVEDAAVYTASGTARSLLANRISYFFDLRGPSMTIDTACSSSLVALHQAVHGLHAGDSSLAIVAGCNLILGPEVYIAESKLHMLSPTGRSRMWDADADGYARGEGVAALLLKPLSQALRDKDHIEGVVRGTGVNSDGRTPGITMPSAEAQAHLIRKAYQAAGLDLLKPEDKCQYFEAHGTGTPTGDPIEANAISDVFFPKKGPADRLFVGSVKTVIGHLEGCAGLAGVIKVLLAMKHGVVPPNLHFNKLNPAIEPYYGPLVIPTEAEPWPAPAPGHPKRASVNSFGFGGTNAHAIIEAWEPPHAEDRGGLDEKEFPGPFVFSANSEQSLLDNVRKTAEHLQQAHHPSSTTPLSSLAQTLLHHRSALPFRAAFSAATRDQLISHLASAPTTLQPTHPRPLASPTDGLGILAIFTGQGAQWAGMAAQLLSSSPIFAAAIARCDDALATLPDRPASFSLRAELLAPAETSRLGTAAIAQPAVTAVQIGLVDMLRAAGVAFAGVVGHSSGEMAALYAAGVLDARDAVRVAYYRGLYAEDAGGDGAMMAVGMGRAAAERFLAREGAEWEGRVGVAAVNAPASVTLSGERAAIEAAKGVLDDEGVFARVLRVDRAYHSKQMEACAEKYLQALKACGIRPRQPASAAAAPVWVSSVRGDADMWYAEAFESLGGQYWVDNLISPVLFADAVEASWTHGGPFDLVMEVGPHAALKGPVAQTLKQKLQVSLPYCSVMMRGEDCVESFARAMGVMWAHYGSEAFDFDGYRRCWGGTAEPRLLKGLPSYSWDHGQVVWRESRVSRNHRLRNDRPYTLLGRRCPDDSDEEPRFRNMLSLKELPWLQGHRFQGQVLFPAAGYVTMVLEGADAIASGRPVKLVDIESLTIGRALTLDDRSRPVETVCSFKIAGSGDEAEQLNASFTCYLCTDPGTGALQKACSGKLSLYFEDQDELPLRDGSLITPSPIDLDRFYESLRNIGLDYTGLFRGLRSASRADGVATTAAVWEDGELEHESILHPAVLDNALQSIFAAYCAPATERLWTAYLPTFISKISVDMRSGLRDTHGRVELYVDAHVTSSSASVLVGDLGLYGPGDRPAVQLEGLTLTALQEADASNDRVIFSQTVWEADLLSRPATIERPKGQEAVDADLVRKAERLALFFFRKILTDVADVPQEQLKWHHKRMIETGHVMIKQAQNGTRPLVQKEWLTDTREAIDAILREHPDQIDFRLLRAVGDNLASVFRGERQILEVLFADDMLTQVYLQGLGLPRLNAQMTSYARQITHRYPNVKILELGAGTGATTKALLESIGSAFSSYTFTDVSPGFFPKAKQLFAQYGSRMVFQTLDIGIPVHEQGFEEHTYDIVLASNVLHITDNLEAMLQRVRKLLRPGGYLLAIEPTSQLMRVQLIMGGLEGWWLGGDDGRKLSPAASATTWDEKLRNSGFSGIDVIHNDTDDERVHYYSSFVSQAVDTTFTALLDPLDNLHTLSEDIQFALVGGSSLSASRLVRSLRGMLSSYGHRVLHFPNLQAAGSADFPPQTAVLCLTELDSPLFSNGVDEAVLAGMKSVFEKSKTILWPTKESDTAPGCSKMMVGLARGLRSEMPLLKLQVLDLDSTAAPDPRAIAEHFLRLVFVQEQGVDGQHFLWTTEPELALRGETLLIPRVVPDREANDRLNSSRRRIVRDVQPADDEIIRISSSQGLEAVAKPKTAAHLASDRIEVAVQISTLAALPVLSGLNLHLCLGRSSSGETVLALSQDNSSTVTVPAQHTISLETETQQGADVLSLMAVILASRTWMHSVPEGSSVWLHDCTESVGDIFEHEATKRKIRVFRTTSASPPRDITATYVHPRAPLRTIRGLFPEGVAAVVVDGPESATEQFLSKVQLCAEEPTCTFGSVYDVPEKLRSATDDESVHELLREAVTSWTELLGRPQMHVPVLSISPNKLDGCAPDRLMRPIHVVDWTAVEKVQVCVEPVDASQLFASDRTYLLVGLTTELGRSICGWMVANGARNLVLTSRAPQVDEAWLDAMSRRGGRVLVLEMDVADWGSVAKAHEHIRREMPPVAGVCNGAMVLSDKTFLKTDARAVDEALKPKVQGSIHLDKLFSDHDLDFFVMLSSLGSVIGTPGQTNYHIANMFMAGLAESRRRKGLAASVLDVGMVADIGYVTRQNPSVEKGLRRMYFLPLSEQDVHFMFAEAIVAGRPDATRPPELITGLRISEDDSERPFWAVDPRLSFFVREARTAAQAAQDDDNTVVDLAGLLNAAADGEAALAALQEAFIKKLKVLLQLQTSSLDAGIPLVGYGVDSLLAMEIRTWFLKETDTDIPVLHIINGASAEGICRAALDQLAAKKGSRQSPAPPKQQEPDRTSDSTPSSTSTVFSNAPTPPSSSSPSPQPQQKRRPAPKPRVVRTAPLSPAQSRIWFLQTFLSDPTTYNETLLYSIRGPLDARRFAAAFRATVARHDALRTAFSVAPDTGEAVQSVLDAPTATLRIVKLADDGADADADADAAVVEREFSALATRVWELGEGVSLGGVLLGPLRRDGTTHAFILGGHHLVLDGVSWARLVRDLDAAYRGGGAALPPPAASYVDYAVEQRRALAAGRWEHEMAFWRRELAPVTATPLPLLSVAQAGARRAVDRYDTAHAVVELGAEAVAAVKRASSALRVTPFHFHLAALQVLVSRLAGVSELCVGVVDAGREDQRYAETVGFFVNVVPVRLRGEEDDTFERLARRGAEKALEALAHAGVPMDAVLDELKVPRTAMHSPLFQVVLNYRLGVLAQETIGDDCRIEYVRSKSSSNPYDLTLDVTEAAGGTCLLSLTGQEYLYPTHVCQLLLDSYVHLLSSLSENPRLPVVQCRLYGAPALDEVVRLGRGPREDVSDWPDTISRRVEQVAASMPDNIAVSESDGQTYTYRALAQKADSVATAVAGAWPPNSTTTAFVCLLFDPSAAFIWSLLGTLKTPAVAVPLDATMPRERLLSIVQDCQPFLILCHAPTLSLAAALALDSTTTTVLDVSTIAPARDPVPNTSSPLAPALAYYTSGTTGTPKGVLVTQSAYRHNMLASTAAFAVSAADTVLQQSSHAFDMSALQIFVALSVGARLAIVPRAARRDPEAVAALLRSLAVTTVLGTPAEWTLLFQHAGAAVRRCAGALRCVAIGGEAFAVPLIAQFRQWPSSSPPPRLFNMYGPTETSMISNVGELEAYHRDDETPAERVGQRLGVGPALGSYSVYVVDAELQPVPPGFPGEICIGGAGVGLGYLNQPELSSAAFVPDPFATVGDVERGWTRMYRTGDRGLLRPDGLLVVLGRMDEGKQVKIRGLRIELDDVAANIVKASEGKLAHAVVVVKGEGAATQVLVGYAVFAADVTAEEDEEGKRTFLGKLAATLPVPEYMRPAVIVAVEQLPLNAQGKVDRAALAALEEAPSGEAAGDVAPLDLSPLERELWSVWQTVLPTKVIQAGPIHSDSDFFRLGGNSMLLVTLQKAIAERWQVDIPLLDMFQASTLGQLAARVASGQKSVQDSTHKAFWDNETSFDLQEGALDPPPLHAPTNERANIIIILTGATGLLGSLILRLLLDDASVSAVHCLAVSPADRDRLLSESSSPKLTVYTGSLGDADLGLTPDQQRHLSATATAILHAGAEGSCLNTYASLRAQNVASTKRLAVALALPRRIPLHYVSSARVVLLSGQTEYPPASVSSFYPAPEGDQAQEGQRSEGFTATKWASEAFLEKCAARTGLRVAIHRSGYLMSDKAPDTDAVNMILAFSKKLGVVPALEKFEGYLDFCDIGNVARGIVREVVCDAAAAARGESGGGGGVRFLHHTDDCAVPMDGFREYMQERYGMPFAVLPTGEWTVKAREGGMSEFLASFILAVDQRGEGIRYPRLLKE